MKTAVITVLLSSFIAVGASAVVASAVAPVFSALQAHIAAVEAATK